LYAPKRPPRQPSKPLLLAEKLHRVALFRKDWIKRPQHLRACACLYYWAKRLEVQGHEEVIASLLWVESRFDPSAISSIGAKGISQIHPRWSWVFEREIWKTHYIPENGLCDDVALGVAAYKVKLREAYGDPLEAVRIYNHATDPF